MLRWLMFSTIAFSACLDSTDPLAPVTDKDQDQITARALFTLLHYQEAHWADHLTYTTELPAAAEWADYYPGVAPPSAVEVTVLQADSVGWQALARGRGVPDCFIFVGAAGHALDGLEEGIPSCWRPSTPEPRPLIDVPSEELVVFVCTFPEDFVAAPDYLANSIGDPKQPSNPPLELPGARGVRIGASTGSERR